MSFLSKEKKKDKDRHLRLHSCVFVGERKVVMNGLGWAALPLVEGTLFERCAVHGCPIVASLMRASISRPFLERGRHAGEETFGGEEETWLMVVHQEFGGGRL